MSALDWVLCISASIVLSLLWIIFSTFMARIRSCWYGQPAEIKMWHPLRNVAEGVLLFLLLGICRLLWQFFGTPVSWEKLDE